MSAFHKETAGLASSLLFRGQNRKRIRADGDYPRIQYADGIASLIIMPHRLALLNLLQGSCPATAMWGTGVEQELDNRRHS